MAPAFGEPEGRWGLHPVKTKVVRRSDPTSELAVSFPRAIPIRQRRIALFFFILHPSSFILPPPLLPAIGGKTIGYLLFSALVVQYERTLNM